MKSRSWQGGLIAVAGMLLFALARGVLAAPPEAVEVIDVQKIWDQGEHNAFTDLIQYKGAWYCTFREGARHVSADGALRVLVSRDGKTWTSSALVTMPDADLRDPKLSVTPQGQLLLAGGGARGEVNRKSHQSYLWWSDDGRIWSDAHPIGDPNFWIWRIVWHEGTAYGMGYYKVGLDDRERDGCLRLYKSKDGKTFETLVADLGVPSYPTEASPLFLKDGTALCLLRRDGDHDTTAMIGTAQAPYTDWTWKSLGVRVGGPQIIQLPDGRFIVVGRQYVGDVKTTQVWWLDPRQATLTEAMGLPSGGDTSYPGLVLDNNQLWVSYYSSHEGKTAIYLARLRVSPNASRSGKP